MHALQTSIGIAWVIFCLYWLASSAAAKEGTGGRRGMRLPGLSFLLVLVLIRVFPGGDLGDHRPILEAIGTVVFASGIALAIWARVHLGRNWGMPMTQKAEPELVTSGPYRLVRHPIYSGLLLAMLGTALAASLINWIAIAILAAYFLCSASIEERNLKKTFPAAYPAYRARTKMLIPFVL
jgi:protein-S-isoprenylcysteine O-methyltransferase Ste14